MTDRAELCLCGTSVYLKLSWLHMKCNVSGESNKNERSYKMWPNIAGLIVEFKYTLNYFLVSIVSDSETSFYVLIS